MVRIVKKAVQVSSTTFVAIASGVVNKVLGVPRTTLSCTCGISNWSLHANIKTVIVVHMTTKVVTSVIGPQPAVNPYYCYLIFLVQVLGTVIILVAFQSTVQFAANEPFPHLCIVSSTS